MRKQEAREFIVYAADNFEDFEDRWKAAKALTHTWQGPRELDDSQATG
jgi:hypothetical protein